MAITEYTNDGVLPPFLGPSPAHESGLMSPYKVSCVETVERFAQSTKRVQILRGWLQHRAALRQIGFNQGFQWLDGSFIEDKQPGDIDAVTFLYFGTPSFPSANEAWALYDQNSNLFNREDVKAVFLVDAFFIDMLDPVEMVVETSRYFLGLFSHQRITMIWKGMLQVRLEDAQDDSDALLLLAEKEQALPLEATQAGTNSLPFDKGGPIDAS
jgi:hypothetical protein